MLGVHRGSSAIECTVTSKHKNDIENYIPEYLYQLNVPIVISRAKSIKASKKCFCHTGDNLRRYLESCIGFSLTPIHENCFTDAKAHVINILSEPKLKTKYMCTCLLDKVSVDVAGNIFTCPKYMGMETKIGNVNDELSMATFEQNRERAATVFLQDRVKKRWFYSIMDLCIDMLHIEKDGLLDIDDADIIEEYFEELIYDSLYVDESLYERWIDSGF